MGSRDKGSTAEREVAKLLETWWQQREPSARFVRVPLSGGWGTPQLRPDFKASGDLATNSDSFFFTVEVKRREGWVWKTLLALRPSPVWGWWRQAQVQAGECGREPMLWFRKSREDWHVMVRRAWALRQRFPTSIFSESFAPEAVLASKIDLGWHPVIVRATWFLDRPPERFVP